MRENKEDTSILSSISLSSLIAYFKDGYSGERRDCNPPREEKSKAVLKRRKHRKAVKRQKRGKRK